MASTSSAALSIHDLLAIDGVAQNITDYLDPYALQSFADTNTKSLLDARLDWFILEKLKSFRVLHEESSPQDCPRALTRFLNRTGASIKKLIASFESQQFALALSNLPRIHALREIEIWFTCELLGEFQYLARLIHKLTGVETLKLWCYRANQDLLGFTDFGDALAKMPALRKLFVTIAPMQEHEILALFEGLKSCLQLQDLELHSSAFDTLSYSACLRIADIVTHLQRHGRLMKFVLKLPRNLMSINLPPTITQPRDIFAFNLAIIRQRPGQDLNRQRDRHGATRERTPSDYLREKMFLSDQ